MKAHSLPVLVMLDNMSIVVQKYYNNVSLVCIDHKVRNLNPSLERILILNAETEQLCQFV